MKGVSLVILALLAGMWLGPSTGNAGSYILERALLTEVPRIREALQNIHKTLDGIETSCMNDPLRGVE